MAKKKFTNLLYLFICLTAVLAAHQCEHIPLRDAKSGVALVLLASLAATVRVLHRPEKQQQQHDARHRLPTGSAAAERYHRVALRLMNLEILFTILIPWILLFWDRAFPADGLLDDVRKQPSLGHLLVPHLFFFQCQIIGEMILWKAGYSGGLVPFYYTAAANALRAFPVGTWILRSLAVAPGVEPASPVHWLVVAVLPLAAAGLWAYSSLVFVPLVWYPVLQEPSRKVQKETDKVLKSTRERL
jgi:hypothetical protein